MSVNKQLENLYNKHWKNTLNLKIKEFPDLKISNPLLIKVNEKEYYKAGVKIMIFGQETYGWWEGGFGDKSVDELMTQYDRYLHNNLENMRRKSTRKFWQGFTYFEENIHQLYNIINPYFIWNNIVKVGKYNDQGMTDDIRKFENKYFSTIKEEIEILKPDIVIFLTGPNRDSDILHNFPDAKLDDCGYPKYIEDKSTKYKTAYKISHKLLPLKSVRLYHPNNWGGFKNTKQIALDILKNS